MSDADIVPLRMEDLAELAALHRQCMATADGWDEPGLARLLQAVAATGFQAVESERIAGFILAFVAADEAEVLSICVAPQYRRQGLGRKLLRALERDLAQRDIARLFLEARVSNLPARRLYERMGFLETARRRAYYPPTDGLPAEDAVMMARVIGQTDL